MHTPPLSSVSHDYDLEVDDSAGESNPQDPAEVSDLLNYLWLMADFGNRNLIRLGIRPRPEPPWKHGPALDLGQRPDIQPHCNDGLDGFDLSPGV